jgi:hypothetical protein
MALPGPAARPSGRPARPPVSEKSTGRVRRLCGSPQAFDQADRLVFADDVLVIVVVAPGHRRDIYDRKWLVADVTAGIDVIRRHQMLKFGPCTEGDLLCPPRSTEVMTCTVPRAIGTVREPSGTVGTTEFAPR